MIDTEREAYYKIINTIYKETGYDPKKIKSEYINNYIRAGKILDSLSVGNPDDGKTKAERYNEEYNEYLYEVQIGDIDEAAEEFGDGLAMYGRDDFEGEVETDIVFKFSKRGKKEFGKRIYDYFNLKMLAIVTAYDTVTKHNPKPTYKEVKVVRKELMKQYKADYIIANGTGKKIR